MLDGVQVIALDARFAEGVPPDEVSAATRAAVAEGVRLDRGIVDPRELAAAGGTAVQGLVVHGAITREVVLAGRRSGEILTPGDIVCLRPATDSLVPHEVRWVISEPTVVALLGEQFDAAARRWPSIAGVVNQRLHEQADRLALHVAISQLARVELRLLALLWHLADRCGRMTPDGVRVPLNLTHEALGRLVGARRPTVTLALAELETMGCVSRAAAGGWMLSPDSRDLLAAPVAPTHAIGMRRAVIAPAA